MAPKSLTLPSYIVRHVSSKRVHKGCGSVARRAYVRKTHTQSENAGFRPVGYVCSKRAHAKKILGKTEVE